MYQHIKRANYQNSILKAANILHLQILEVTDGHGSRLLDGKLEPLWYEGTVIGTDLAEEDLDMQADDELSSSDEASELSDAEPYVTVTSGSDSD